MSGRKRTVTEERRPMQVYLPVALLESIDRVADTQQMSRTEVVKRVLEKYVAFSLEQGQVLEAQAS